MWGVGGGRMSIPRSLERDFALCQTQALVGLPWHTPAPVSGVPSVFPYLSGHCMAKRFILQEGEESTPFFGPLFPAPTFYGILREDFPPGQITL